MTVIALTSMNPLTDGGYRQKKAEILDLIGQESGLRNVAKRLQALSALTDAELARLWQFHTLMWMC
jgi:hypothetical protein